MLTMVLILLGSAETPFALNTCLKKVSSFVENTHLSLLILAQLSSSLFSVARRLCLAMTIMSSERFLALGMLLSSSAIAFWNISAAVLTPKSRRLYLRIPTWVVKVVM